MPPRSSRQDRLHRALRYLELRRNRPLRQAVLAQCSDQAHIALSQLGARVSFASFFA